MSEIEILKAELVKSKDLLERSVRGLPGILQRPLILEIIDFLENPKPNAPVEQTKKTCVSCDEEKEVHEICIDCAVKLGGENQPEESKESHNRECYKTALCDQEINAIRLCSHCGGYQ